MSRRDVIVTAIQSAAIPVLIVGATAAALLSPGRPGLTLLAVALAISVFALIQVREHKLIAARNRAFRDAETARTHAEAWRTTAHKEWMRRHLSESDARIANGGMQ